LLCVTTTMIRSITGLEQAFGLVPYL